jgi:intein-encoded DNA endonuclease-like protein
MKERKLDNFRKWRNAMKAEGKIKSIYPSFVKDGDFAELIGVILGDGNIGVHPRTEKLTIAVNSNNHGFIQRYSRLVKKVIGKNPTIRKQKGNCVKIYLYENNLAKRLEIPAGNRRHIKWKTPKWIWNSRAYLIRYLRGLYEAEGNFAVHRPTYTYKMFFVNRNRSLLNSVYWALPKVGVKCAHMEKSRVTVSRKAEVLKLRDLLEYRHY